MLKGIVLLSFACLLLNRLESLCLFAIKFINNGSLKENRRSMSMSNYKYCYYVTDLTILNIFHHHLLLVLFE